MFECVLLPGPDEGSNAKSSAPSTEQTENAEEQLHEDLSIKEEEEEASQNAGEANKLTDVLAVDKAGNGTWDVGTTSTSSHESPALYHLLAYTKTQPTPQSSKMYQASFPPPMNMKLSEAIENRYICQICTEIFHSASALQFHVEKMHCPALHRTKSAGVHCKKCNASLSSSAVLKRHMATVHKQFEELKCKLSDNESEEAEVVIPRPHTKLSVEQKNIGLEMTCMNDNDEEKPSSKNKNKNKYACKICDVKMSSKTKIMTHMFTAHCNEVSSESDTEGNSFVCYSCNTQFSTQIQLDAHEHIKCPYCDSVFPNQSKLETHLTVTHDVVDGSKTTSQKTSQRRSRRKAGYDVETEAWEGDITEPEDVDKDSENNLKEGEDSFVQGDTFWDDQSSDNESSHSNIEVDEPQVETWKRVIIDNFVCNYCFKNFRTKMALYEHGENEHSDKNFQPIVKSKSKGEGAYKCDKCKATFNYLPPLIDHKLKHRGILPYACKYCRKIYATKRNLIFHCNRFHCSKLEEELQSGALSKRHLVDENGELPPYEPDKLEDFGYIKVTPEDLNHKRQVIIVCSICKTRFKTLFLLYKHCVQFHSDHIVMPKVRKQFVGPIKCKMCDFTFTKIDYMRQHLIRHFDIRPYMCKYCGKIYADRRGLLTHKQQLHVNEVFLDKQRKGSDFKPSDLELNENLSSQFTCDICNQDFLKLVLLRRHMKEAHTFSTENPSTSTAETTKREQDIKIESYALNNFYPENEIAVNDNLICNFCGSSFKTKRLFVQHCQAVHGLLTTLPGRDSFKNVVNKCNQCERTFPSNRQLRNHLMVHDGIRPYCCPTCQKSYSGKSGLDQHCRKVHGKIMKRKEKPLYFKKSSKKEKKTKVVSDSDSESSSNHQVQNMCETILKEDTSQESQFSNFNFNQNILNAHTLVPMPNLIEKTFSCLHCGIIKYKKSKLIVHMMSHFNCKFKCKNCPHKFKTVRKWKSHLCDLIKYPYLCTYCGYRFKTKPKLLVHKSKHEKTVVCDECGKRFHNTTARNRHKACYHDAPQHLCPECGAVFGLACQLDRHLRNHKEMKHACDSCPRKFWDHRQLQHHRNMEHKEKRFICELCGRALSQKWHYDFHMERHAGIRKYGCQECNKSYTSTNALKYHNRTRHPERVKNKM